MKVDSALTLAKKGMFVFPIRPNTKIPLIRKWGERATIDVTQIRKWWDKHPDANIGIATGPSKLLVIDVDLDKYGFKTLKQLEIKNESLPHTFLVETPSGGLHYYFLDRGALRTTVQDLGQGVDTRGRGGYVVGPGSNANNGTYRIRNSIPVVPVPRWIIQSLQNNSSQVSGDRDDCLVDELDSENAIESAFKYLSEAAHPAIEFDGGDLQTYQVACTVRDLGISEILALEMMLRHYNERCDPPWELGDLAKKVHSAYKNAQNPQASLDASTMFEPYEDFEPPKTKEKSSFTLNPASSFDLEAIPPRDWVLGNRLIAGYVTVTVAPGGTGKSIHAMLEALSIASGLPLCGYRPRKQGRVLIYNTEDPRDEILRRLSAMCIYHGLDESVLDRVYIESGLEEPLVIARETKGQVQLTKRAKEFEQECSKIGFKAIFIDPFVRTHQINENDNSQMDTVVSYFSQIAMHTKAAISLIHHTRKNSTNDSVAGNVDSARGASALVDASRIASTLTRMSEKEAKDVGIPQDERRLFFRLDNAKGNMAAPALHAIWFALRSVDLPNGDAVGTLETVNPEDWKTRKEERIHYEKTEFAQVLIPFCKNKKFAHECAELIMEEHSHLLDEDTNKRALTNRLCRMFETGFNYENVTIVSFQDDTTRGSRYLKTTQ